MTKQKLTIAELQEPSFSMVLNKRDKSLTLGGDIDWERQWEFAKCMLSALWRASNPEQGKNIKSASVEM